MGDLLTPSALLFEGQEIVVGREAAKSSVIAPEAFAECFKRDMGANAFHHQIRDISVPPEVLSGFILQRLKNDAEHQLGEVRQVVITVPAFFDETRRKATQDAGRLAGLEVLDIINEPTAAAVSYGYAKGFLNLDKKPSGTHKVLVY
ncbi:MAG: Hsp70 family protein, partial [Burkholderiales bacterium]|nr:Hsp70 family protein [Burkholderiales bacterium]